MSRDGLSAHCGDLIGHLLGRGLVQVGDRDARTLAGHPLRDSRTDPRRAAGDDHNPAVHPPAHRGSSFSPSDDTRCRRERTNE